MVDSDELRRPLGLTLLTGLYFFFFLVSISTFGNPYPFLGTIYTDIWAKVLVFADSLMCLYLFLGTMKRQLLTWYFLIAYNLFQVVNTIINLTFIKPQEVESLLGARIQPETMWINNIAAALAILLLTQFIYRHKNYFTNSHKYLF
jgi:hypothetical protein